jgi:hypothetical protein
MKIKHLTPDFFIVAIIGLWLTACEREVIVPDLKGNLVGYLLTYNEFEYYPLVDNSRVLIETKGLDGNYSTYSDDKGRYEFTDLPAGTYDLNFSKEGFGKSVLRGVRHLGGKPTIIGYNDNQRMYVYTRLYKIPSTQIEDISLENDSLVAKFNFENTEKDFVPVYMYFSDHPDFENKEAEVRGFNFEKVNGQFRALFNKADLPFQTGAAVYCRASVVSSDLYGCLRVNENNEYTFCTSADIIYPTLGHESNQFSFIFP